ncbi:MAG: ClbS/DfsB family four-helix bundle protein [Ignavibacteriales bacterium]|nr:ClbS/DfsB family four-helix bundle protein [Ignavibacteriales bacterium]
MPRPKTKDELIELSNKNFKLLKDYIESFSEAEQNKNFPKGTLNRNIRDVLAHLHEWHEMMLVWYNIGMKGGKPIMPAKGYTWKTLPDLNMEILKKYSNTDLEEAKTLLNNSFAKIQKLIEKHSNEDLFLKQKYEWTGTTSLGAYLISSTSSHYDWAYKIIKKAKS